MIRQKTHAIIACLITAAASVSAETQVIAQRCTPKVTANVVVASPKQRYDAGQRAEPPLTDTGTGFAWPDTPMGVIKTGDGYEFFASDGGAALPADVARSLGRQQQVRIGRHHGGHARQPARHGRSPGRQRLRQIPIPL